MQVRQREQRQDMCGVLRQPFEAQLRVAEEALDRLEEVLRTRTDLGLAVFALLQLALVRPFGHSFDVPALGRDVPSDLASATALVSARVAGVGVHLTRRCGAAMP